MEGDMSCKTFYFWCRKCGMGVKVRGKGRKPPTIYCQGPKHRNETGEMEIVEEMESLGDFPDGQKELFRRRYVERKKVSGSGPGTSE